jgi:hypothetical protein
LATEAGLNWGAVTCVTSSVPACDWDFADFAAVVFTDPFTEPVRDLVAECMTDSGSGFVVLVNMHDGVADGRIDPSPLVVKFGAGADGVDDLVGRGHDVCGVLDHEFERMEDVAAAPGVEPAGVDATIDRRVVRDAVCRAFRSFVRFSMPRPERR